MNSGVWRPPPNGQTDEDERKTIEKSEGSEFFCRKYLAEKKNVVLLHSQTGNNDTRERNGAIAQLVRAHDS